MKLPKYIFQILSAACLVAMLTPALKAQAQTDLSTPTNWLWLTQTTVPQVISHELNGLRVVDIEVENASPVHLSVSMVQNTGVYAKNSWWYVGLTFSSVNTLLVQNNARLIDVEPYLTTNGVRFAVVMIENTGSDFASNHGWQFNFSEAQVDAWVNLNPNLRILDLQTYDDGTGTRFAFTFIGNSGAHQSDWWYFLDVSSAVISSFNSGNDVRMIDLERTTIGGGYSAVFVPGDGELTHFRIGMTLDELASYLSQNGFRLTDIERHEVFNGPRFSVLMRYAVNERSYQANGLMRAFLSESTASGLS
ncbi:MAG: hypothetical protein P1V35_02730, partial [Planctomycetota bacterium]|nr:hypothetical protein [Planctomycetota bacterium]